MNLISSDRIIGFAQSLVLIFLLGLSASAADPQSVSTPLPAPLAAPDGTRITAAERRTKEQPLRSAPQLLPGVYGYGMDRGANPAGFGSSSTIIHVKTLDDNGNNTSPVADSLRAAVNATGSRIVVFDISGVIELKSTLTIPRANLTIAGQTAPSPGIALHGASLIVKASNVLIQHIRVRPGDRWLPDPHTHNRDAVEINSGGTTNLANVVFDHCTFAWSLDEMASTWNAYGDVTFNKCIFAEPLFVAIHVDEGTFARNLPPQAENLTSTTTGFSGKTIATSGLAVNGAYQQLDADSDGDTIDFTLAIVSGTRPRPDEHLVVASITGPDRAMFKVEVRDPSNTLLQSSEVFDQYAPAAEAAQVSHVAQAATTGFTLPANITSLKVRLIVSGRNAASTGWKLGVDLISLSQGHGMGPLFGSGTEGTGRLSLTGSIIAHVQERGPWASSKQFVFANNVLYNRRNRFVMLGHTDYWPDPVLTAIVGNTFVEGQSLGPTTMSPIARQKPAAGTQIFETDNGYNYGDRASPAPLFDPNLATYRVTTDPTEQAHGLLGFVPLPHLTAYESVLLSAGARPNDRDSMESRVVNEIAAGATIAALAQRPGKLKNSVAEAGGWPVYAQNKASWNTPIPSSPNADDDGDSYTNIEEWLQQLSAQLEGASAPGAYQAEFALLGGGSTIKTIHSGFHGTGYVNFPASSPTSGSLTFNRVDGRAGGTKVLRIRYARGGSDSSRSGQLVVNGVVQNITFKSTSASHPWATLEVPVTLGKDATNTIVLKSTGHDPAAIDELTIEETVP